MLCLLVANDAYQRLEAFYFFAVPLVICLVDAELFLLFVEQFGLLFGLRHQLLIVLLKSQETVLDQKKIRLSRMQGRGRLRVFQGVTVAA